MRVLVIGGTGLISTAAVNAMIRRGHEVTVLNRGQTNSRIEGEVHRLIGDRHDLPWFTKAIRSMEPEAVLDAIAFTPEELRQTLDALPDKSVHMLFISTVCTYGPLSNVPANEDEPHTPISTYGKNKSACDFLLLDHGARTGQPVTVLRPSHCYGPGQPLLSIWGYDRRLVHRLREGLPIAVHGDGEALWQPGFVCDLAEAVCEMLGNPQVFGKALNLVGHEIMTWREFFERMGKAIGVEANLVYCPSSIIERLEPEVSGGITEIFRYHGAYDDSRLRGLLPGYTQRTSWEDGVRQTVEWIDEAGEIDTSVSETPDDRIAAKMEMVLNA